MDRALNWFLVTYGYTHRQLHLTAFIREAFQKDSYWKFCPAPCWTEWKKDLHAIQRWPTLGCEEKTQVLSPSWCTGTIRVSECMVWYGRENEKETEWLIFCGQKNIWRGDAVRSGLTWGTWLSPRDMVISVPGLLLGSMAGFMALMISMALDTTQGQEYRVLQSWPCPLTGWSTREKGFCPSLSEAPRRESPTPHWATK